MNQATMFNLVGGILLVVAITLHIVCLSTPYYAHGDLTDFVEKAMDMVKKDKAMSSIDHDNMQQIVDAMSSIQGMFNYGMWKVCIEMNQGQIGMDINACVKWGKQGETPDWIKGAQAMAILGTLAAGAGLLLVLVNTFVTSRGDRLRLLPLFVLVACVVGAVFTLTGDIIIAAKYQEAMDSNVDNGDMKPPQEVYDLMHNMFSLSWGFALDIVSGALMAVSGVAIFMGGRVALSSNGLV